ncbi:hypothetical protein BZA05DRAFT_460546 [Tricharina praecox]|uniref:uncharacterized protein n=1 Tax=Tricharina praecox TaxID=43433 RepID=UPI002220A807|nr:uncharacterized protein BZA05DRAFT_460546 [Tricharina praecox]KAI5857257.1 hypothetical protein BZA05DRAFT_460546 [Tricharina praecox]
MASESIFNTGTPSGDAAATAEQTKAPPAIVEDSWVNNWDLNVLHCGSCERPFVTKERLSDHMRVWHSAGSPSLPPYEKPASSFTDVVNTPSVTIVNGGDLFIETTVSDDYRSPDGPVPPANVRFLVSSSVLWAASRVFNCMFGPDSPYQERIDLRQSWITGLGGPSVVELDDDRDGLQYVFNALHYRHGLFRHPSVLLMAAVSAITEKYELHTAMQLIADEHFRPLV